VLCFKSKAELLNDQFKSVFTKENVQELLPEVSELKYPSISDINIEVHGVVKLLTNLNMNKTSCPDNIANKVLKACTEELVFKYMPADYVFEKLATYTC
jgi:hypothetical protein